MAGLSPAGETLDEPLARFTVRIFVGDQVAGAGILVPEGRVLTCAHVVARALRVAQDKPAAPAGSVRLDFPLIAPRQLFSAEVARWWPVTTAGSPTTDVEDVALLTLVDSPPRESRPARRWLLVIAGVASSGHSGSPADTTTESGPRAWFDKSRPRVVYRSKI